MKNEDIRWVQRFNNYCKAVTQLSKFIEKGELNELEEQGLIKSFEYTHELAWKTLKDFLEHRGNDEIYGSKDTVRQAFKLDLITEGDTWMNMIRSRNQTSHTYNEDTAKEIVTDITDHYYTEFIDLQKKLNSLKKTERG